MTPLLLEAIIFITLALIFYTIGVLSEKFNNELKTWHLVLFYLGLFFDTLGTSRMTKIAGGFDLSLHGITGVLAILLMLFHAIWATIVLIKKDEVKIKSFHKLSIIVWVIWLVPYFLGMLLGVGVL